MITSLTKQQLAFILDIKVEDARGKMCHAWCKDKGIENTAYISDKKKVIDSYPLAMSIDMLSKQLNLPTLQQAVNDIVNNYLVRPGCKKWILYDYPEKEIKTKLQNGKPLKVNIPSVIRSFLPGETQAKIKSEWKRIHPLIIC